MQPPAPPPPGWYPHSAGTLRYWDGQQWTADIAPAVQAQAPRARAVSGMSTGENILHLILTICTIGLWAPLWWLRARLSRRRIIY
jgi:hypothetical protein